MDNRHELKVSVIEEAMKLVAFEGWSKDLLSQAAAQKGLDPSYGWRLFPNGVREAIVFWNTVMDERMVATLPSPDLMRVRDRIALGVKTRLMLLEAYREGEGKTARFLMNPLYVKDAAQILYRTVNEIWFYAGDSSTDYNFYTKRGLLAWVYSTTFLYWLKDTSEAYEKTWDFLNRRIEEVLALPHFFKFPWKRHG